LEEIKLPAADLPAGRPAYRTGRQGLRGIEKLIKLYIDEVKKGQECPENKLNI
jgi:hypothetical protein